MWGVAVAMPYIFVENKETGDIIKMLNDKLQKGRIKRMLDRNCWRLL